MTRGRSVTCIRGQLLRERSSPDGACLMSGLDQNPMTTGTMTTAPEVRASCWVPSAEPVPTVLVLMWRRCYAFLREEAGAREISIHVAHAEGHGEWREQE